MARKLNDYIKSFLDNDLYKFSMGYAVIAQRYDRALVDYNFIDRSKTRYPAGFGTALQQLIHQFSDLKLTDDEYEYLQSIKYFPPFYIDFLRNYQYDPTEIQIYQNEAGYLFVTIHGYWYRTIFWEVPLLAIISQLAHEFKGEQYDKDVLKKSNIKKQHKFHNNNIKFADFGTRRRFSYDVHDQTINDFINAKLNNSGIIGTSNVYLAKKYNIIPIGTHAHEWFMFHAVKYSYQGANKASLNAWVDTYDGDLGIALSDTFTTQSFFNSFKGKLAKLFDGVRHDSGDPFEFGLNVIKHYESLNIDPKSKTIVFSDGLDVDLCVLINDAFAKKINVSFGIGTHLTCDLPKIDAMNIVIKMTFAKPYGLEMKPTIKLSDNPAKQIGPNKSIEFAKYSLGIQNS